MPAMGTPEHEEIFKQWVQQIRDHMNAKGLSTADWAFYGLRDRQRSDHWQTPLRLKILKTLAEAGR